MKMYRELGSLSPGEKKVLCSEMKALQEVFELLSVQYMISGGTLLGAIREGDFIPWDWDVEYTIIHNGNRWDLIRALKQKGLVVYSTFFAGAPKIIVDSVVLIEVFEFKKKSDGNYCRDHFIYHDNKMVVPDTYMDSVRNFKFNGMETKIPESSESYLTHRYGDWSESKKYDPNNNDHTYLTEGFAPSRTDRIHVLLRVLRIFLRKVDRISMTLVDIRLRYKI